MHILWKQTKMFLNTKIFQRQCLNVKAMNSLTCSKCVLLTPLEHKTCMHGFRLLKILEMSYDWSFSRKDVCKRMSSSETLVYSTLGSLFLLGSGNWQENKCCDSPQYWWPTHITKLLPPKPKAQSPKTSLLPDISGSFSTGGRYKIIVLGETSLFDLLTWTGDSISICNELVQSYIECWRLQSSRLAPPLRW